MAWEFDLLQWFQTIHNPVLDYIMAGLSLLGEAGILWIGIAIVFLCIPRYRKCGFAMAIALILSLIFCNGIMKNLVQRDRPFWIDGGLLTQIEAMKDSVPSWLHIVIPTDFSFPSGHTSASFAAAAAILMLHRKEGIAAIVVAALISLSRLYIGVHFPTDVLVSLVLGTIYGIVAVVVVKFIYRKIEEKRGEIKENA